MDDDPERYGTVDPVQAGLKGRCPRCGEGRLFAGFLSLAKECDVCHLDYGIFDSADGPAFFVMTIVGFLIVGLALYVEVVYSPSILVHLLLWIPLTAILTLPLLRFSKGLLIALQHRNKAEQGRLVRRERN